MADNKPIPLTRDALARFLPDARAVRAFEQLLDRIGEAYAGRTPLGGIIEWSGAIADIPENWALCDGTNGTPNLTDRFVIGAGGTRNPGDTGGTESATTSASGDHNHGVGTLANANEGAHTHTYASFASTKTADQPIGGGSVLATGAHSHIIAGTTSAGSNHTHTLSGNTADGGDHTHTVDTMPPWYALAYIMRVT